MADVFKVLRGEIGWTQIWYNENVKSQSYEYEWNLRQNILCVTM